MPINWVLHTTLATFHVTGNNSTYLTTLSRTTASVLSILTPFQSLDINIPYMITIIHEMK